MSEEGTRTCKTCGDDKDLDDFPLNGDRRGGRRWQCKSCMRDRNRQWRDTNKTRVAEYNKTRKKVKKK